MLPVVLFLVALTIFAVLAVSLVGYFQSQKEAAKRQRDEALEAQNREAAKLQLWELEQAFSELNLNEYLAECDLIPWWDKWSALSAKPFQTYLIAKYEQVDQGYLDELISILRKDRAAVGRHNEAFIVRRLDECKQFFDNFENNPLTLQQRRAIVTNENANLITAGPGTGKTSTIVGRIAYLLNRNLCRKDQILALAFTNKAKEEMEKRLSNLGITGVKVSTVHAVGQEILKINGAVRERVSKLAEDPYCLHQFLRELCRNLFQDREAFEDLLTYFTAPIELDIPEDWTPDDRLRAEMAFGLRALDGIFVKSLEEKQIANWFVLNGVRYIYECDYPYTFADKTFGRYRPDFYISDYNLYLEHFGVDENGRTSPHVNEQRYLASIKWKRDTHKLNRTVLLETYSWMNRKPGGIRFYLEQLMEQHGVSVQPLTQEQIDALVSESSQQFTPFVKLLAQFLTTFKATGANFDQLNQKARNDRDRAFLRFFSRVYEAYEQHLKENGEIDFSDMINRAVELIRQGGRCPAWTQIIIDEFQDITLNQMRLLEAIRGQDPKCRFFAVGDDWQSIYRFNGGDPTLIVNYPQTFPVVARVDLKDVFRFPQSLLDICVNFITRNPNQLKKALVSRQTDEHQFPPISIWTELSGNTANNDLEINQTLKEEPEAPAIIEDQDIDSDIMADWDNGLAKDNGLAETVKRILDEIEAFENDKKASVLVLSRYNFTIDRWLRNVRKYKQDKLQTSCLTVHAAKGKEADYVIVVDLEAKTYGFPCQVTDDPVMHMVLAEEDGYPFSEERRLFFVAMTRAKKRVYLICPTQQASIFVAQDLLRSEDPERLEVVGEVSEHYLCPNCQGKTIRRKVGSFGEFWSCEHWPRCHGRLVTCPACKKGCLEVRGKSGGIDEPPEIALWKANSPHSSNTSGWAECVQCHRVFPSCPTCGKGVLLPRDGRLGPFLGCSEYGPAKCRCTENLAPHNKVFFSRHKPSFDDT